MTGHVLDLELELLSPCFMGDAHQRPELRIASLRGLWRYWYRALYGQGDEMAPSSEEIALFGSTKGRGRARLVLAESVRGLKTALWQKSGQTGADYLLFTMDMNKRSYLEPGVRVPLRLLVTGDENKVEKAERSLAAALSFGGIGARARRMAGAVYLACKSGQDGRIFTHKAAANPTELAEHLRQLLTPALSRTVSNPRYHVVSQGAFSAGVLERTFNTWREALDEVGSLLRVFRSRRQPDYDVAKAAASTGTIVAAGTIRRAAFGLPIQFRFKSLSGKGPRVTLPQGESDRRGSPFLLTLERIAPNRFAVVWCLFRSALTPSGRLKIGGTTAPTPDYTIIDEMLGQSEWKSHRVAG